MALAKPLVRDSHTLLQAPVPMLEEAKARGLSPQQLEDLLELWGELHWYPPRNLYDLVDELAR